MWQPSTFFFGIKVSLDFDKIVTRPIDENSRILRFSVQAYPLCFFGWDLFIQLWFLPSRHPTLDVWSNVSIEFGQAALVNVSNVHYLFKHCQRIILSIIYYHLRAIFSEFDCPWIVTYVRWYRYFIHQIISAHKMKNHWNELPYVSYRLDRLDQTACMITVAKGFCISFFLFSFLKDVVAIDYE